MTEVKKEVRQMTDRDLMNAVLGSVELSKDVWEVLDKKNYKATRNDLEKIKGMNKAKIDKVLVCMELSTRLRGGVERIEDITPKQIWERMADIRENKKEHFVVFYLNSRDREIERDIISVGTLNASLVHPREVFTNAIKNGAVSVIGVHNHPSNDVEPSDADFSITKRLVRAGEILGINFTDHIIVSKDRYYSIREEHEDLFD